MNDLIKENRDKVFEEVEMAKRLREDIEDDFTGLAVKLSEADEVIAMALPNAMLKDWKECIKNMQDDFKPYRIRMESLDVAIMLLKFAEFALKEKEQ